MKKSTLIFLTVFVGLLLLSTVVSWADQDTIKIGLLEDASGNFALHAGPKYLAAQLAVKEI